MAKPRAPRKPRQPDLLGQPDPRAPLDGAAFLKAARPVLAQLAADLLERARSSPAVAAALQARHDAERAAHRTADDPATWQRAFVDQVAAAWLLSCVFARTLEDRGRPLLQPPRQARRPGCESDEDGEPVYGWAGWDHLQQAQALADLYQKRKTEEAWPKERLTPMLAGLLELLPWVKQWHNDPSDEFGGLRLGDYFETFVDGECRTLGLTHDDLKSWRPPEKKRSARGGRKKGAAATSTEANE